MYMELKFSWGRKCEFPNTFFEWNLTTRKISLETFSLFSNACNTSITQQNWAGAISAEPVKIPAASGHLEELHSIFVWCCFYFLLPLSQLFLLFMYLKCVISFYSQISPVSRISHYQECSLRIKMSSTEQFFTSTEILNLAENCSMLCEEPSLGVHWWMLRACGSSSQSLHQ